MFRNYTPNISEFSLDQPSENGPVTSRNIWGPLDSSKANRSAAKSQVSYDPPYDDRCGQGSRAVLSDRFAHLMQSSNPTPRMVPGPLPSSHSMHSMQQDEPWTNSQDRSLWAPQDDISYSTRPLSHFFPRVPPFNVHSGTNGLNSYTLACPKYDQFAQFSKAAYDFKPEELKQEYKLFNEFKRDRLKQKQKKDTQERENDSTFDIWANIGEEDRRIIENYFSHDTHGRVKITAGVLNRRYARERERFEKSKLLEKVGMPNVGKQQFVLVEFKAGRLDVFSIGEKSRERLESGSYVMVKADRGKDLGRVVETSISLSKARYLKVLQLMESHMAFSDISVELVPVQEFLQRNSATVTEAWDTITKTKPTGSNGNTNTNCNSNSNSNSGSNSGSPNCNSNSNANCNGNSNNGNCNGSGNGGCNSNGAGAGAVDKTDKGQVRIERYPECRNTQSPKFVVSLARAEDVYQIISKRSDEDRVCRSILAKMRDDRQFKDSDRGINMSHMDFDLVDAEYQFDRKKLIIYYSSSRRIDFRDLVRDLFRVYKTRIWMSAVNGRPASRTTRAKRFAPRVEPAAKPKDPLKPDKTRDAESH